MFFQDINFWTVLIAAVVGMGLGFIWYSPILFAKRWMKDMGYSPESMQSEKNKGMAKTYAISTLFTLVTAYIVAAILNSLVITGFGGLILLAFLLWLAFSMPIALNYVLFGKDTFVLFLINSGYQLATLILMALVIGIFG